MADEYTGTGSLSPTSRKINGFTGEEEDAAPLNLSASPGDQRILAAPPHTDPLPELVDRLVNSGNEAGLDVEEHVGPSLKSDSLPGETPLPYIPQNETPDLNADLEDTTPPTQYTDVPPPNDIARDEGAEVNHEGTPYPGLDTKAYNDSLNARLEAEAEGVPLNKLPDIEPAVPGDEGEVLEGFDDDDDDEEYEEDEEADGVPIPTTSDDRTSEDNS